MRNGKPVKPVRQWGPVRRLVRRVVFLSMGEVKETWGDLRVETPSWKSLTQPSETSCHRWKGRGRPHGNAPRWRLRWSVLQLLSSRPVLKRWGATVAAPEPLHPVAPHLSFHRVAPGPSLKSRCLCPSISGQQAQQAQQATPPESRCSRCNKSCAVGCAGCAAGRVKPKVTKTKYTKSSCD